MKHPIKRTMAAIVASALLTAMPSCSSDDSTPQGTSTDNAYSDKTYGNEAIAACTELCNALLAANNAINTSQLTDEQSAYLKNVLAGMVDLTIVPTYKEMGDAVEDLHNAIGGITEQDITQADIDNACAAFKRARKLWEKSEAFLGGAASDFNIDPHIDSWPLNRTLLHSYFKSGEYSDEALDDASILGFHALEFILFRNGQPRQAGEFKANDTYNGFTDVSGADELKYAKAVIADLLVHVYELEVAWDETPDAGRLEQVKAAGLGYLTERGYSYGYNLKNAGNATSTFANLKNGVQQVLSLTEGSCFGIANEVGTAKIANPFSAGDISYVESPYSYNSITDFQDNIVSIENVWYGSTDGAASDAEYSFHKFFADNSSAIGKRVENAISNAIGKIGAIPPPFVKYVSTIWNKDFATTEPGN